MRTWPWASPLVPLVLVLIGAVALRLRDLGDRSLWVDELFGVALGLQDLSTVLTVLYGEEANMTLYYLFMLVWMRLGGGAADEVWVRLPSLIFGVAGIWALYRLGARLDRPTTGVIAALLAAVNAYHIEMSQEARAYTLWALCITLSWDALVASLDSGRRAAWLRYVAFTALAFYAHFFTVFVVLAQIVVVGVRWRQVEMRNLILSGVGVVLLCSPFLPFFLLNNDGSQILHVRRSDLTNLRGLMDLFAGASRPLLLAHTALGLLGTGSLAWLASRAGDSRARRAALARSLVPLLWLLVPTVTLLLISYARPMFKERYLFAAMPAFPLLAALGLAALRPRLLRPLAVAALVALAAVPLVNGLEIRQSENWRAATAYIQGLAQPDDGWIFISKRGQLGYEYYAGRLRVGRPVGDGMHILEPFDWQELAGSQGYYRSLASGTTRLPELAARHQRIWLVLSHEYDSTFDGDTSEAVRDWFSRRGGVSARQRTFQNIRVLLYERR